MIPPDFPYNEELVPLASTIGNRGTSHVRGDKPDALRNHGESAVLVVLGGILTGQAKSAVSPLLRDKHLGVACKVPDGAHRKAAQAIRAP
jgi:hypothetical protein